MNWKAKLIKFWNFWPPFVGAGISILKTEADDRGYKALDVRLKLRFWNSNYVGTQFGGSLFAMTDPFLMVMLVQRLGPGYVVWDKVSTIRFRRPGRSDCFARFEVAESEIDGIKVRLQTESQFDWVRVVEIRDSQNEVVATVEKTLYVATRAHYEASRQRKSKSIADRV